MPVQALQGASETRYRDEELFSLHEWARLLQTDADALLRAASSRGAVVINLGVDQPHPLWKRFLLI